MASVPNMRLTAAPHGKESAATADNVEGDLFARLLTAMPALEPGAESTLVPGAGDLPTPAADDSAAAEEGDDVTSIDLALPAQAAEFLPLIEAQVAAPVTANPAPVAEAKAPAPITPAAIGLLAKGGIAATASTPAAPAVDPQLAATASTPDAPAVDPQLAAISVPSRPVTGQTMPAIPEALAAKTATAASAPPATVESKLVVAAALAQVRSAAAEPARTPKSARQADPAIERPASLLAAAAPALAEPALAAVRPARKVEASLTKPVSEMPTLTPSAPAAPAPASLTALGIAIVAEIATPAARPEAPAAPTPAEILVEHELDLARDAQWLDQLARDIAGAGDRDGTMRFRLHPQTLGHLRVELTQSDAGTAVRLTAETEAARAIIADAQPRLLAEARAQGVRISEAHVDLAGSGGNGSADARRQDGERQNVIIRTARGAADEGSDSPAAGPARSDRYA